MVNFVNETVYQSLTFNGNISLAEAEVLVDVGQV